ncbi:MAG: hypothetical protein K2H19_02485, partial [Ruminococcus sp.]|nr:hypothetical protein [Ruminococcus sp.]
MSENKISYITFVEHKNKNNYIYSLYSPLGDPAQKLRNLFKFRVFIKDTIANFQPQVVIASHWDSLAVCSSFSRSFKTLIYENLDMPTGNKITLSLLRLIEKFCLKKVDITVFASRFFLPYYKSFRGKKIILENLIPDNFIKKL